MLTHFIEEFIGYSKIGGGYFYDLYKYEEIIQQGSIDEVLSFIANSSFEDSLLLVNPSSENKNYVKRILYMMWSALHLQKELEHVNEENCIDAIARNEHLRVCLFGETSPDLFEDEEKDEEEEEDDV